MLQEDESNLGPKELLFAGPHILEVFDNRAFIDLSINDVKADDTKHANPELIELGLVDEGKSPSVNLSINIICVWTIN